MKQTPPPNKIDCQLVSFLAGHSCIKDKRLRKDKGQRFCNVGGKNANCLERERVNQMVIKFKPNKHSLCLQRECFFYREWFIGENMNGLKDIKMKVGVGLV